jgi:hypothetical protein
MPGELRNDEWELSEMVEHLSAELDEVADTLALRAQRREATYSPTTVSFELNVTSRFDGAANKVVFRSGQPGEQGLSKLRLELAPVPREQLQIQPAEVVRPRDPRPIDLSVLLSIGILNGPIALHKLLRLGIRTMGDLAELAGTDVQRQALEAKTGIGRDKLRTLLRPYIAQVVPEQDQLLITGYHFGTAEGTVLTADRKPLPVVSWSSEMIRVRRPPPTPKTIIAVSAEQSSSEPHAV